MLAGNKQRNAACRQDVRIFLGFYQTIPFQHPAYAVLERNQQYNPIMQK